MTKLKFPPLHKAVGKEVGTSSSYIHIVDYHAVLLDPSFTLVVDLKSYFYHKKSEDADPDYDYENAMDVLYYLDRKHISGDFWLDLVNAPSIQLSDDESHIIIKSRGTTKELYYTEPKDVAVDEIKKDINTSLIELMKISKMSPAPVNSINFDYKTIKKALEIIGVKDDDIQFEMLGENKPLRFTLASTPWIFGQVENSWENNDKLFKTEAFDNFFDGMQERAKNPLVRETVKMIRERKAKEIEQINKDVKDAVQTLDVEFEIVDNGQK
jgi:hypothetical protein